VIARASAAHERPKHDAAKRGAMNEEDVVAVDPGSTANRREIRTT